MFLRNRMKLVWLRYQAERLEAAKKLEQIGHMETKLKAAHRSLFRLAKMRLDLSELKDPDYGPFKSS
eukprot:SAG31_NODE_95_length_25901_cov_24.763700_33_plen_67_part_00